MINANVLATGSKGNAVILNGAILIDCGVPYKTIAPFAFGLSLVLLTHSHGDHFNGATIRKLASERPTLRFGCCGWLAYPLLECGVKAENIDVYELGRGYGYSLSVGYGITARAEYLSHDIPNCGYHLLFVNGDNSETAFYATDTENLDGIAAENYDLYMLEANYDDGEIAERIRQKEAEGQFCYEWRAIKNHLSRRQADSWLARNIGDKSYILYLHQHAEKAGERQC